MMLPKFLGEHVAPIAYAPLPARAPLRWPGGQPVALTVLVLVEYCEFLPAGRALPRSLAGGFGTVWPYPNLPFYGHREYGHRVGVFRVLDAIHAAGAVATVAMDAMSAERYPLLVSTCLAQQAEIVAHGIAANLLLSNDLSESEERSYIADSRDRLAAATGRIPVGWCGPEQTESVRTPQLLEDAGFQYVCDWPNDEQPYFMETANRLVSLPTMHLLEDVWTRDAAPGHYNDQVMRAFATLALSGQDSARSLVLVVRPWLTGQPFRIGAFENALTKIVQSGSAWPAHARDVVDAFRSSADP